MSILYRGEASKIRDKLIGFLDGNDTLMGRSPLPLPYPPMMSDSDGSSTHPISTTTSYPTSDDLQTTIDKSPGSIK